MGLGYDKSTAIVYSAYKNNSTLKETAMKIGGLKAEEFDDLMQVQEMIRPSKAKKT